MARVRSRAANRVPEPAEQRRRSSKRTAPLEQLTDPQPTSRHGPRLASELHSARTISDRRLFAPSCWRSPRVEARRLSIRRRADFSGRVRPLPYRRPSCRCPWAGPNPWDPGAHRCHAGVRRDHRWHAHPGHGMSEPDPWGSGSPRNRGAPTRESKREVRRLLFMEWDQLGVSGIPKDRSLLATACFKRLLSAV
jgi:hypothetical protein